MTPDEIVKALRENAEWCDANEYEVPLCMGDNQIAAADLIESLQAQFSASQRREKAAVEDIPVAHDRGRCEVCKHKRQDGGACKKWPDRSCFEWRGPQDGKGETE